MATPGARSKTLYVSFNPSEYVCLRQVGFRERWLYSELKWLANFKTGAVGSFYKQCLSYAKLAALVTVPEEQGRDRGLCSIDDKEAARILDRLERVGLVANIHRNKRGGLAFTLPLSPVGSMPENKPENITPTTVAEDAEKLPDDWGGEDAAEPLQMGPQGDSGVQRSVLKDSYESYTFSSDISNAGAADTAAPPASKKPPPDTLTLKDIQQRLRTSKARFIFLETETSAQIFAGWVERAVPPEAFERAVSLIESDDGLRPTPSSIDTLLRTCRKKAMTNPRLGQRSSNWGRVWL